MKKKISILKNMLWVKISNIKLTIAYKITNITAFGKNAVPIKNKDTTYPKLSSVIKRGNTFSRN